MHCTNGLRVKQAVVEAAECPQRLMQVRSMQSATTDLAPIEDARWACSLALSRETGGKHGGYIYPLLDLANHAWWIGSHTGSGGRQSSHVRSTSVPPDPVGGAPQLAKGRGFVAKRKMSAGEQLFDNCAMRCFLYAVTCAAVAILHDCWPFMSGRWGGDTKCVADHPIWYDITQVSGALPAYRLVCVYQLVGFRAVHQFLTASGFAVEDNHVGLAQLLDLPSNPAPQWLATDDLPSGLLRCAQLLQSAHRRPHHGEHLYHTRTWLQTAGGSGSSRHSGISELMVDCVRLHMSFNNLTHARTAVAEGSFLVASSEMKNAFRSELSFLRRQIAAAAGGSGSVRHGMEPEQWIGSRKWRYAVQEQQFAERVASTDRAVRTKANHSLIFVLLRSAKAPSRGNKNAHIPLNNRYITRSAGGAREFARSVSAPFYNSEPACKTHARLKANASCVSAAGPLPTALRTQL